ncbi:MAG: nuclear transport factor 2 family protein [Cyclobacteriaceae bacterium]
MNKSFIFFFLIVASFSIQAQSAEETVLGLSKDKFGWMIRMQYDSLEAMLDDRLVFVHSNGWVENKQEIIEDIKSGKLRYVEINVTEASARIYQAMAIVNGKGVFKVLLDEKPLEIALSYTEVYVQQKGKWLLASRHSNRMP